MALPYLKNKNIGVMLATKKIEAPKGELDDASHDLDPGLVMAAEMLTHAITDGDATKVAQALKDAFLICDSMPHSEYDDE